MAEDLPSLQLAEPVTVLIEVDPRTGLVEAATATTLYEETGLTLLYEIDDSLIIMQTSSVGPPGSDATDKYYDHVQNSAATVWTITHNLAKNPAISVVDSGGTVVIGQVAYIDLNTATVTFSVAFGGHAYCD